MAQHIQLSLDRLQTDQGGVIASVHHTGSMYRRLADLGFVSGAPIVCVGKSPMGDPHAFLICGAVIALRNRDSRCILIRT